MFLLVLESVIVCTQPICPTAPMETADEDHPTPSCSGTTAAPPPIDLLSGRHKYQIQSEWT